MKNIHSQQGVILPLTLIILAILTVMASVVMVRDRNKLAETEQMRDQWQARLEIHNAEQRVMYAMLAGEQQPGAYQLGNTLLLTDGTPVKLSNDVWVSIQDQAGLLSLRFMDRKLLTELFRHYLGPGSDVNTTQAIIDWQTPGGEVPINQTIIPRKALFRSLDELMLLPSITPEIYNGRWNIVDQETQTTEVEALINLPKFGLRDLLTLSGQDHLNYAATPDILLQILYGFTADDIERLDRLKANANWRAVQSSFQSLGMTFGEGSMSPGVDYTIRFQYQGVKARGEYEIYVYSLPVPRISWYFPDQYRYFTPIQP
ncbi:MULTISPECIES: hypothetical protein [unclassified Vibrio]|uniref:hypothetical protein n=1 Tax=unclassified Vibrio TaxID=2614977 RepID=UPI000B8EA5A2|nr:MULTISPECIES: hypothetical protein [unclassified Vibrio]NAX45374.1 hypothetical protein [Vibrio sp. V25_P4S6T154]OXX47693.1 hypothetical protein B9J93_06300 [Vibrio sp. V17_P4S1T151]OXX61418.1 hypothetical protein B9J89_14830 [Vibrio sp. V15_P4S5T153]OXX67052.1 hypothetical protein B9J94_11570 [Vibrio sp. V20_P4S3T152]